MKIIDFNVGCDTPIVVGLGFFDSVHKGHISLLDKVKSDAKKFCANDCVFTFSSDLSFIFKKKGGLVYSFSERLKKFEKLQISTVIFTSFTKEFASLKPEEFLNIFTKNFNVVGFVCGNDYRYGNCGEGNLQTLKTYCENNGISLTVCDQLKSNEVKISSSKIKELLENGQIEKANDLLGFPYFISGVVEKGRRIGRELGFPTANVKVSSDKIKIKLGVYKTHIYLDGVKYQGITNYGGRPTFDLDEVLTETYVDGFSGNLYGKEIDIFFEEYMRPLVKFNSVDDLKKQLQKDLKRIK